MRPPRPSVQVGRSWWKTFFDRTTGDIMFKHLVSGQARQEVDQILRLTGPHRGARILDVGCGTARHGLDLARRGFHVTGLDYSREYLAQARRVARRHSLESRLELALGDMRELENLIEPESVDLVLSLYNSFGYFASRAEDLDVLRQMSKVLRPGGAILLSTMSRRGVERSLRSGEMRTWLKLGSNRYLLDRSMLAPRARFISEWTVVGHRNNARYAMVQNLYSREDLAAAMTRRGLRLDRACGSLVHSRPLQERDWDMTLVARKPISRSAQPRR